MPRKKATETKEAPKRVYKAKNSADKPVEHLRQEARRHLVLEAAAQGMTYSAMVNKFTDEWGVSRTTTELAVKDALGWMRAQETKDNLVAMNLMRLDTIISDSMSDKDRKNAVRAIDVQNKLAGGYTENIHLDTENEVNLIFET